jgi:hypothetical protein
MKFFTAPAFDEASEFRVNRRVMSRGDHVYIVKPPSFVVPFRHTHHGIDCGDGTIIHYAWKNRTGIVARSSIEEFAEGQPLLIFEYPAEVQRPWSAENAIRRAESRLGESSYDLLRNNCEHFANWCCIGLSESEQADSTGLLLRLALKFIEMLPRRMLGLSPREA